jgi:hypothetical protein
MTELIWIIGTLIVGVPMVLFAYNTVKRLDKNL